MGCQLNTSKKCGHQNFSATDSVSKFQPPIRIFDKICHAKCGWYSKFPCSLKLDCKPEVLQKQRNVDRLPVYSAINEYSKF
jgi:hypothetical protein